MLDLRKTQVKQVKKRDCKYSVSLIKHTKDVYINIK